MFALLNCIPEDFFPPQVILQLLGPEEPQMPPLTHYLDIELRSFDPAEGYMEVMKAENVEISGEWHSDRLRPQP